jgi:hypothetical protein
VGDVFMTPGTGVSEGDPAGRRDADKRRERRVPQGCVSK